MITQYGLRQLPVFVGQTHRFQEILHYIAPPHLMLTNKLAGLQAFWEKTIGQSSIMRAEVLSFAFVYIHPLADGNGRVHRFLVNDLLYRDGILSEPMILPISSAISDSTQHRRDYDKILDTVSKPLMAQLIGEYQFETTQIFEDGIKYNLHLGNVDNALPIWRFLDLTPHVLYLAKLVSRVIQDEFISRKPLFVSTQSST
ncbi:Fic family protein [Moraxella osloensis]|uniref:Fic family protein n=1 Tax=Faucicola osloensis TaxID=34062 RepID=UPI001D0CEE78|nr:Fic family protein [Moraxella osloensis]